MTYEKTYAYFTHTVTEIPRSYTDKAIEALEKQIPKKPNDIGIIGVSIKVGACPLCSEACNYAMAYCDRCGQALDWSEEK